LNACPAGWHLPSVEEFVSLIELVGERWEAGGKLKSTTGWDGGHNGTDDYSFTALPGGYRLGDDFRRENFSAYFWSSTENNADDAFYMDLDYDNDSASVEIYYKVAGFSIRCLKGETPVISSSSSAVSSSSVASSSSIAMAAPCKTESEDNCEYGTLTDNRDGQTYKTVKIGDQIWMAENLNYEIDSSFCYNDSAEYCDKYGRLYTWAAAVGKPESECGYGKICSLPLGNIQGVCPSGWHMPSKAEWDTLFNAVGGQLTAGKMLKSTSDWIQDGNGTDEFGFSVLPSGYVAKGGSYSYAKYYANLLSSTEFEEHDGAGAYVATMSYKYDYVNLDYANKSYGFSVRCVKD